MNTGILGVDDPSAKKKGMRKIILLAVTVLLSVSVVSCGLYPNLSGKKRNSSDNDPDSEPVNLKAYDAYMSDVLRVVFSDAGDENYAFSPLNLYLALSMTAETTDGDSLQQILDVLHQPDLDSLRSSSEDLLRSCLLEETNEKLLLGNSLWMNSDWDFNQAVIDSMSEYYQASAFSGDPSSEEFNRKLQEWLHTQTEGLIDTSTYRMDPGMVLGLYSTVDYAGKWSRPFESEGVPGYIFHAPSGDISSDFLQLENITLREYYGDHFSCVVKDMNKNGSVRFVLPEEGMTPKELLQDEELLHFMSANPEKWEKTTLHKNAKMMMPQIDFTSRLEMTDMLEKLGVKDIFQSSDADFSRVSENPQGLEISSIEQENRIVMDRDGVKAASITSSVEICWGISEEPEMDWKFILDRPFLFEIVSESGVPLFVGIVNVPWKYIW
ncbi:MAG: hypothetical protein J5653_08465 [Clostridiales bacterium]|nr:hypothetical protein [Clostridiales bacterium]